MPRIMTALKQLYNAAAAAAALAGAAAGCVQTTTISRSSTHGSAFAVNNPAQRSHGVTVEVYRRELRLQGDVVSRKQLVKRLLKMKAEAESEKSKHSQSSTVFFEAIVLKAKEDVPLAELAELRDFLIENKLPRVMISTPKTSISYSDSDSYSGGFEVQ
jgi:hypothetical protein